MRLHNWATILAEEVEAARKRPFEYGVHDCIQFPARIVAAITGIDHRVGFPSYATKEEAQAIITEHGSLVSLIGSVLPQHPAIACAGRGDVVVMDTPEGEAGGICLGNFCAFAAPCGVSFHPRGVIKAAFRV